ncbi:MAG TPA: R3H domain-containing nucleic acid-binding protein [Pedococcus sp.]|nr:R3H domain-containing nucleic acid-binding protein [Pedococcus sp.]
MTEQSGTAPVTESAVDVADTLESVAATEAPSAAHPEAGDEAGSATGEESTESTESAGDNGATGEKGATGENGTTAARGGKGARVVDLEREGEVAADFLETLLDIADLDGDIDVDVDGDRAAVAIVDSDEGRVPRRLVGPDGKVLEALQELTRLAVQSATGERSRLMLDVAGHRAERRAALVEIAQGVIAQVKSTGEQQSLEPMSAFERKVVHDEVLAAGLASESEGVEPRRHVVVLPA